MEKCSFRETNQQTNKHEKTCWHIILAKCKKKKGLTSKLTLTELPLGVYVWSFFLSSEKSAHIFSSNQDKHSLNCSIKRGVEMLLNCQMQLSVATCHRQIKGKPGAWGGHSIYTDGNNHYPFL